jgi:serine/threonine protein kinase
MAIDPNDILSGELSKWKVLKTLGSGGFKEVFLAEAGDLTEALKITKIYDSSASTSTDKDELETMLRARTEREFHLLQTYGGGCIVSLGSIPYQECEVSGNRYAFYSEEYLPGKTLDKINVENKNSGKTSTPEEIKAVFSAGLNVIEKIWCGDNKIVHRDIKPGNIMKTGVAERPIVFFDLGIAFDKSGTSLTAQTFGPGTLWYRAPETLDPDYRASIDFRCDLFSLAVTVYEYAAGFHPIHHGSMSDGETVYRLLKRNAVPLLNHRADLGTTFCSLIDRCIHKRPALRPNRITEIKRILEV